MPRASPPKANARVFGWSSPICHPSRRTSRRRIRHSRGRRRLRPHAGSRSICEELLEGQARLLEAAGPDLVGVGSFDLAHGPERLRDDAPAVAGKADELRTAVAFVWPPLQ